MQTKNSLFTDTESRRFWIYPEKLTTCLNLFNLNIIKMEGIGIEVLGMGYYQEEGGGNIVWTNWNTRQGKKIH